MPIEVHIWGQPTSFCIKSVECRTNEYINNFKSFKNIKGIPFFIIKFATEICSR